MHSFAKFISYLVHPLTLPTAVMAMMFYVDSLPRTFMVQDAFSLYPEDFKWRAMELFTILTLILPALSIGMMRMGGYVTDLEVSHARERNFPLMIIIICYSAVLVVFALGIQNAFTAFMVPALTGSIAAMLVALFSLRLMKISGHMMALGIATAIGYCYFQTQLEFPPYIMVPFIAAAGLLAMARYVLGLHTLAELAVGYSIGFIFEYVAITYDLNPVYLFK